MWLPAYLEPRACWFVSLLVRVVRAGWKWLPACLEPRVLGWCVLVGVSLVGVSLVGVSLVRAGWCALLVRVARAGRKWLPACLEPCIPGSCALLVRVACVLVGVVTCMP